LIKQSAGNTTRFTGFIVAFIGAVLFSTKAILVKKAFADTHVPALSLLVFRMLFALPFYLIAAFFASSKQQNIKFTGRVGTHFLSGHNRLLFEQPV